LLVKTSLSYSPPCGLDYSFRLVYFFIAAQMPLYFIVLFGCYALCSIGYHLLVLEDCTKARDELQREIKLATSDLQSKGVKL
jgi:hypothetical protein